jgi:DNA repair protein RecO (recombination protein O)
VPSYRRKVLALKKTKLGESDLIITFLAEDGCQIRAVAKGARKTTSRFGARLEPYSVAHVLLAAGRTLEIVTDAEIAQSHTAIREDYDRSSAAAVVADFLDKVSVECQGEERLFGLATATLDAIEAAAPGDLLALVVAFLLKGMSMHGYRPQLGSCASCGSASLDDARFSFALGGPVCAACAGEDPGAARVSADARAALGVLMRARMAEVAELAVPTPILLECLGLLRRFVAYHVSSRLKALDLYASTAAP